MDYTAKMQTIAEMPEYQRRSMRLLSEQARKLIIDYLAAAPKAGVLTAKARGKVVAFVSSITIMMKKCRCIC